MIADVVEVVVTNIHVPAMSTLGYGHGLDVTNGDEVDFVGDHRLMRDIGHALMAMGELADVIAVVPARNITNRRAAKVQ